MVGGGIDEDGWEDWVVGRELWVGGMVRVDWFDGSRV